MNFRDDWSISILLNLAAALLYGLFVQPWLEPFKRAVGAACVALYQRLRSRATVLPLSGSGITATIAKGSLSELPAGTDAATVMAMLPTPQRSPQLVNQSIIMQWWQHEHDQAGRFGMASTMPGFKPALLSPPSAPTGFALH